MARAAAGTGIADPGRGVAGWRTSAPRCAAARWRTVAWARQAMSEDRKRAAIELVRTSYLEADALFRSLDPADLERPVFTGEGPGWRVRDIIAHYAYWQTFAARSAERMATDRMPGPEERLRQYLDI